MAYHPDVDVYFQKNAWADTAVSVEWANKTLVAAVEAWKKLTTSGKYDDLFKRCWETTGCLITADGSEDDKVKPEGLHNYKVPPPIDYVEPMVAAPVPNNVPEMTVATDEEETPEVDTEEDNEGPDDEGEMQLDNEEDRSFEDEMVGKVKVLYESGWSVGNVMYYNKALMKYKISFSDGTNDYIPEDEIGSAEVQVV